MKLQGWASKMGLRLPFDIKAFQGGSAFSPSENLPLPDKKNLTDGRPIATVLAKFGGVLDFNRVAHLPTGDLSRPDYRFDATLSAYRNALALKVAQDWNPQKGPSPIPVALNSEIIDGKYAIAVELRKGLEGLGFDGPLESIHHLDLNKLKIEEIPHLLDILDAIHIPSDKFLEWSEKQGIQLPSESWLKEGNKFCALRGHEWWINPDKSKDDRLRELTRLAELTPPSEGEDKYAMLRSYYQKYFGSDNFPKVLEEMIKSNLPLYRYQNGTLNHSDLGRKDEDLLGESVVVHGLSS